MIDTNNKECRYITSPNGKAQIDFFLMGNKGAIDRVMVWLGEYDPKSRNMRPHLIYAVDDCEEYNAD